MCVLQHHFMTSIIWNHCSQMLCAFTQINFSDCHGKKKTKHLWWDLCTMKVRETLFSKINGEKLFKMVISVMDHSVHMTVSRIVMLLLVSTSLVKCNWSVSLLVEPLWPSFWQEASEAEWSLFPNTPQTLAVFCVRECLCSQRQWDSPTEGWFSHQSQWLTFPL